MLDPLVSSKINKLRRQNYQKFFTELCPVLRKLDKAYVNITDIDGDGYKDIVFNAVSGAPVQTFRNNRSGGVYTSAIASTGGASNGAAVVGDFNGDGVNDLFYAVGSGSSVGLGISAQANYLERFDLKTRATSLDALSKLAAAALRIQTERGNLGASLSRFERALGVLQGSAENSEAAAGRIQDADVATESANLARHQILQQISASILAQANQQPQIAVQLLRG